MSFRSALERGVLRWATALVISSLAACGGSDGGVVGAPSQASASDVVTGGSQPGSTPFIAFVRLNGAALAKMAALHYTIEPRTGSASKPVDVRYERSWMLRRGYYVASGDALVLPVFGLYAGYANRVAVDLQFDDGSIQTLQVTIQTAAYADPASLHLNPAVLKKREPGSALGFDFFLLKSGVGGPVVVDTDAQVRWVGIGPSNSFSTIFQDGGFIVGEQAGTAFWRLELDGSTSRAALISPTYTNFHHNIDPGKVGMLVEVTALQNVDTILAEVSAGGAVLKEWDFAALLGDYMRSQGDDPSSFIRPGADWFHMNAAVYDPRDDSVVVSGREDFVLKADYRTGEIRWLLGDPTKYWYSFPSLRAKALTMQGDGLYPIGQHAISITPTGDLVLFNDGAASFNQPVGAPVGESRSYSTVSTYRIDEAAKSVRETSRYDHGQDILSDICSSAYLSADGSMLVDYAAADNRSTVRLVGLDPKREVVFDFQYASGPCLAGWNAIQVPFDAMQLR